MTTFSVYINRSFSTSVDVEADSPEAAEEMVGRADFALPPIEHWAGNKDWIIEAEEA